jgi:adhesin HecA-like repeat protein
MSGYNSRIIAEQGGSHFRVASGGSLTIEAGAQLTLNNGLNISGASLAVQSGGIETFQAGASLTINHGASDTSLWRLNASPNLVSIFFNAGRDVPTYSASPGALYFRSDGSVSAMYWNISSGTTGSVWRSAASG